MQKTGIVLFIFLWSMCSYAQDLAYCGEGYYIDLSIGYTPTGLGLELCNCTSNNSPCELVHIVLRRTIDGHTDFPDCPEIILTERWWREKKDLVDIYYASSCIEISESSDYDDRYVIDTRLFDPGDTISILVCKTNQDDPNVMELSASPGNDCSEIECPLVMDCPVETLLTKNLDCVYLVPDFTGSTSLTDTCQIPAIDVTSGYVLMQNPPSGSKVTEDLFVEITALNQDGEVIIKCDVSVILAEDRPPSLDIPAHIDDIESWETFPPFESLVAIDTFYGDSIYTIRPTTSIDPYLEDACSGYSVTYRWTAVDLCGLTTEETRTFNVLPDLEGPRFASLPADIDTIRVGQSLPLLVNLVAINPDGTSEGITMSNYVESYIQDDCHGYDVTYHWRATDSCGNYTELTKTFYVEPDGLPPVFISPPDKIDDIFHYDSLPAPQVLQAISADGDTSGIRVFHSIDTYQIDPCNVYDITYRWTAIDSCGNSASVSESFSVLPDTLSGFILAGMTDMMIQISLDCAETAAIEIPLDTSQYGDRTITVIVTDDGWNVLDEYIYEGPEDYDFGMGEFHIIYLIEDLCGNEFRDTINLSAIDVAAPVFVCPDNTQILVPDLGTCSAIASWALPQAFDNCDSVEVVQTGGPELGTPLGVGYYDITYTATDQSLNIASCTFQIIVSPMLNFSFDCKPVSIELDTSCSSYITKEAIIGTDLLVCAPNLELVVITEEDTLTGDSFQLGPYYGQEIKYILCEPTLDLCCENRINLIDNISPVIACIDTVFISCLNSLDLFTPQVLGECGNITWLINDLDEVIICNDQLFTGHIIREYIAIDESGNASQPCIQTFLLSYVNIDVLLIEDRIKFPRDTILTCEQHDILSVSAQYFGVPMIDTFTLSMIPESCGISATFTDEAYLDYGCTKIIKRHWSIWERICGKEPNEINGIQLIRIIDTTPPQLQLINESIIINTSNHDCIGFVKLPNLEFLDNCQEHNLISYKFIFQNEEFDRYDSISMPLGLNYLVVESNDGCRNIKRDTILIEVKDKTRPVAACLEKTILSITNGLINFPASSLDIGSYDNCELSTIQIKKSFVSCSSKDTTFGDYVQFCCSDVGKRVEVILKTIDQAGNTNYCEGIITVQDKSAPKISCPPHLILNCSFPVSESENEKDPYGHLFGGLKTTELIGRLPIPNNYVIDSSSRLTDGIVYDNCEFPSEILIETRSELNQCGIGFIYRTFTARDQAGNTSEACTQIVQIKKVQGLEDSSINWPEEEVQIEYCNKAGSIDPEQLGRPELEQAPCTLFGISYDDTYIDFYDSHTGACSKIIRKWTVINWCENDPYQTAITKSQIIKVSDKEPPLFAEKDSLDNLYRIVSNNCSQEIVEIRKRATDNCTGVNQLQWSVKIDLFNNGNIDIEAVPGKDSLGVFYKTLIAFGQHKLIWNVVDKCGNLSESTEYIHVENAKAPGIIADGISTTLTKEKEVTVWTEDLFIKSDHPCYPEVQITISRENESLEQSTSNIIFNCQDIGINVVKVFASYVLSNGQVISDFVSVKVDIEDNFDVCESNNNEGGIDGHVAGLIFTEQGKMVPGVQVELFENETKELVNTNISDNQGVYVLGQIEKDKTYILSPHLNADHRVGISTLDLVLMERHILGMSTLNSPFKIISGDVNNDKKISVIDILEIRRAILYLPSVLENHDAWKFLDVSRHFKDIQYPLNEDLKIPIYINHDSCYTDLIAIKMGDVNGSAVINNVDIADNRDIHQIEFEDKEFSESEEFQVALNMSAAMSVYGYQLGLKYNRDQLELMEVFSDNSSFNPFNNIFDNGKLLISGSSGSLAHFNTEQTLVFLKFKAITNGLLSKVLFIDNEKVNSEVYNKDLEGVKISMRYTLKKDYPQQIYNSPNPFIDRTQIHLNVSKRYIGKLTIHDITGKIVMEKSIVLSKGKNAIEIERLDIKEPGIYIYAVTVEGQRLQGRMILLE